MAAGAAQPGAVEPGGCRGAVEGAAMGGIWHNGTLSSLSYGLLEHAVRVRVGWPAWALMP